MSVVWIAMDGRSHKSQSAKRRIKRKNYASYNQCELSGSSIEERYDEGGENNLGIPEWDWNHQKDNQEWGNINPRKIGMSSQHPGVSIYPDAEESLRDSRKISVMGASGSDPRGPRRVGLGQTRDTSATPRARAQLINSNPMDDGTYAPTQQLGAACLETMFKNLLVAVNGN